MGCNTPIGNTMNGTLPFNHNFLWITKRPAIAELGNPEPYTCLHQATAEVRSSPCKQSYLKLPQSVAENWLYGK